MILNDVVLEKLRKWNRNVIVFYIFNKLLFNYPDIVIARKPHPSDSLLESATETATRFLNVGHKEVIRIPQRRNPRATRE